MLRSGSASSSESLSSSSGESPTSPTSVLRPGESDEADGSNKEHAVFRQEYELGKTIGNGVASTVRQAVHKKTGAAVAVKIVTVPTVRGAGRERMIENVKREISALKEASHDNVIRLQEVYLVGRTFYLVTDLCTGGDLLSVVLAARYEEAVARVVIRELASGLAHLHAKDIVHGGVKLENVLLSSRPGEAGAVLAGFGRARQGTVLEPEAHCGWGTVQYMAPEVLQGGCDGRTPYTNKADMWSLGVVAYVLLSGQAPFYHPAPAEVVRRIKYGAYTFEPEANPDGFFGVSAAARDFVAQLLRVEQGERLSAEQVLSHPWMKNDGSPLVRRWGSTGVLRPSASADTTQGESPKAGGTGARGGLLGGMRRSGSTASLGKLMGRIASRVHRSAERIESPPASAE